MSHSRSSRARSRSRDRASVAHRLGVPRNLCRQAASFDSPLGLELWASSLLGQVWERRVRAHAGSDGERMLVLAKPILRSFAEIGGSEGRIALTAVARIDRGGVGSLASRLAATLHDAAIPGWVAHVGTATIARAFAHRERGDGEALLLQTEPVGEIAHMLGVYISEPLGGIATALNVMRAIDPLDPEVAGDGVLERFPFRPVDPVRASGRALGAIERTESTLGGRVDESFPSVRALAIARLTPPQSTVGATA